MAGPAGRVAAAAAGVFVAAALAGCGSSSSHTGSSRTGTDSPASTAPKPSTVAARFGNQLANDKGDPLAAAYGVASATCIAGRTPRTYRCSVDFIINQGSSNDAPTDVGYRVAADADDVLSWSRQASAHVGTIKGLLLAQMIRSGVSRNAAQCVVQRVLDLSYDRLRAVVVASRSGQAPPAFFRALVSDCGGHPTDSSSSGSTQGSAAIPSTVGEFVSLSADERVAVLARYLMTEGDPGCGGQRLDASQAQSAAPDIAANIRQGSGPYAFKPEVPLAEAIKTVAQSIGC